jgi:hypothetical protein
MSDPIHIGSRLELLLDDHLIERLSGGATQRLCRPEPRGIALLCDRPWEGNACAYVTVFRDGDECRMYYKGWHLELDGRHTRPLRICLAVSRDGKSWTRPNVGRFEIEGTRANNVVFLGEGDDLKGNHGFAPFKDTNPACRPEARYKALGASEHCKGGLFAMSCADGVNWTLMQDGPVITLGKFDSQNVAFWDVLRGEYRAYVRDFENKVRGIRTATSRDFIHWTTPEWLTYPGAPVEQLYTNQIAPYPRAPHLFIGFPTRYTDRGWDVTTQALPEPEARRLRAKTNPRYGSAVTDGLFMSSRDGKTFKRWGEAFIRPGLRTAGNWVYGDNYQNWGVVETAGDLPGAPPELSFYSTEGYWRGTASVIRRFALRADGFVAINAPLSGGELLTRPLIFDGARLLLNLSTSGAGCLRIEIQDPAGSPLPGFALADGPDMVGDALDYVALWKDPAALAALAGRPVRLRFVMKDADLYAFRFIK